jgi:hypothetical protein
MAPIAASIKALRRSGFIPVLGMAGLLHRGYF